MALTAGASRQAAKWAGILAGLVALPCLALVAFVWLGPALVDGDLPSPADIPASVVVNDRDGRLLRAYTAGDGRWRMPVTRDAVDPRFIDMLLAYEDKRFFSHSGVDARAIARAAWQAVRSGRIVSGGSTLTMQVARLIDGGGTRTAGGKLRQLLRALQLERRLSKDEVLALYLARAPYGGNIEGIAAASYAYFGKRPERLSLAEAALLVALPQAPEARRPDRHPQAAKAARGRVLQRMVSAGVIGTAEAEAAAREPMPERRRPFPMRAAHAADRARASAPVAHEHTLTIDGDLQARLEDLARTYGGRFGDARSVAIIAADHASGEILASVGSPGYLDAGHFGAIDMTRALRSPGSTLKPLIYGLAFEEGIAHPQSLIEDRPISFSGYAPKNFDRDFRGTVSVSDALALSLNVPAVTLLDAVGPARLLARLKRAGAKAQLPPGGQPGLAIGLGGLGVSLHDLVALYAAIGRGGAPVALYERPEEAFAIPSPPGGGMDPVLAPLASWYVGDILARTPPPRHAMGGRIAFKTGTSYGYRDAWALGFDGRTVIGVWTGRPDGGPVAGATGQKAAAPILFDSFARLGRPLEDLAPPPHDALVAVRLPSPLRHVRGHPGDGANLRDIPRIAYPPDGAVVDLGLSDTGGGQALRVKVRSGRPPFLWFANGVPIAAAGFRRAIAWTPDGPGFTRLSVIDVSGGSASVSVQLR